MRTAQDSEELARGFVPVALRLGQLRAAQETLATLVDGIPDERNPLSTRLVIETLSSVRRAKFVETRTAMSEGLAGVGDEATHALAVALTSELDAAEQPISDDSASFEHLFASLDAQDKDAVNRALVSLGALEHDAGRRLRALSEHVASSMDELSARSRARERRAILALIALAVLTLSVGVAVSLHTRRLLLPLARVTERAQAVARGDLTSRDVVATDDEIGQLAAAFEKMVAGVARAQSRAVANERLAAIGKMAAHVTHEIRNPLSSIGLNIELLDEELAARRPFARTRRPKRARSSKRSSASSSASSTSRRNTSASPASPRRAWKPTTSPPPCATWSPSRARRSSAPGAR